MKKKFHVIGIASYIASNIPAGSKEISNRSWNPEFGLNASYRPEYFAVDISASYVLSDIAGKPEKKAGEIFNLNTAISGQIPLSKNSGSSLSPVLEMTYSSQAKGQANPANNIIFLSPGTSFIYNNLALEILIQIPVLQSDEENVMKQESRLITGVKFLF
ncbi:MAG: hypothetical protein U5Q03_00515 [Bacteroidota bacterium]|nr:hypothetical protein [Bacteroidota bacterium]